MRDSGRARIPVVLRLEGVGGVSPNPSLGERGTGWAMLEDFKDRTNVMLTGALAWMFLATVVVRGKLGSMTGSGWQTRSFNGRVCERMLRGVPIRGGALLGYALFGLSGLGLGLVLIAHGISFAPWFGATASNIRDHTGGALVPALFAVISAGRLLFQILIQAEWDSLVDTGAAQSWRCAGPHFRERSVPRHRRKRRDRTECGCH
jgi:hypothetical protein